MKKAIAFISALFLIVSMVPVDAFADSSVALPQFVFSLMFQSVTTPSFVDVTNYNAATDTTSSGTTVSLANSVGSYSQINRTGIPVAQNLICVKFSVVSPSTHFFDDITIEPYINGSPAHLYGTYTQSDYNNQIDYYMFFYIGEDSHRIKNESGQDITPWGIRITTNAVRNYAWNYSSSTTYFYYYNYTLQSQTVDPGEAAELALQIINVLQLSQLSENLGMINTQLDTGNIVSMMQSMLTYISQIPDIISYIDQLETTDNNILSAISTFYTYFVSQNNLNTNSINSNYLYYRIYSNGSYVTSNLNYFDLSSNYTLYSGDHVIFTYNLPDRSKIGDFYILYVPLNIPFTFNTPYLKARYWLDNGISANEITFNRTIDDCYVYYQNDRTIIYVPYCAAANFTYLRVDIEVLYDTHSQYATLPFIVINRYTNPYIVSYNQRSVLERIYLAIKQLTSSNTHIPSDVQQTTDVINQNAQAVNVFQSSTQQSLDNSLQNVPVAQYQIQATTGTQYMKAYSEALFNASNGFRIWFMLPLILFLIGMLIRWGIKK